MGKPARKMKEIEYGGLCATCNHTNDCTFPRDPNRPVIDCNEFDCREGVQPAKGPTGVVPVAEHEAVSGSRPDVPDSVLGLCRNCEHYGDCELCKRTGGVWHCEEYC